METRAFLLHAFSPLHAGTGQSTGIIDLPIARIHATGIPFVPGSSIKGVLRDVCQRSEVAPSKCAAVFGPLRRVSGAEGDSADIDHAGALVVSDARLVALPVRSFFGTFALVSSPLLLHLARRDLREANSLRNVPDPIKVPPGRTARCVNGCINIKPNNREHLYLEELNLPAKEDQAVTKWAEFLGEALPEAADRQLVRQRLVIVDDETMTFLCETATQVDTRVRIDNETGVVAKGQLWTEESLPAETLLMGLVAARDSMRSDCTLKAAEVLDCALPGNDAVLQFGGKATAGKGRCRMCTWPASN